MEKIWGILSWMVWWEWHWPLRWNGEIVGVWLIWSFLHHQEMMTSAFREPDRRKTDILRFVVHTHVKLKTTFVSNTLFLPVHPPHVMQYTCTYTNTYAGWIQTWPWHQRSEDWRQCHYNWAAICEPPPPQPPVLTGTDLNDIDSRIHFLHEIMSAQACHPLSLLPLFPTPLWPTEVLNNYISFQRLIWLRTVLLVPFHHSCFQIFYW